MLQQHVTFSLFQPCCLPLYFQAQFKVQIISLKAKNGLELARANLWWWWGRHSHDIRTSGGDGGGAEHGGHAASMAGGSSSASSPAATTGEGLLPSSFPSAGGGGGASPLEPHCARLCAQPTPSPQHFGVAVFRWASVAYRQITLHICSSMRRVCVYCVMNASSKDWAFCL